MRDTPFLVLELTEPYCTGRAEVGKGFPDFMVSKVKIGPNGYTRKIVIIVEVKRDDESENESISQALRYHGLACDQSPHTDLHTFLVLGGKYLSSGSTDGNLVGSLHPEERPVFGFDDLQPSDSLAIEICASSQFCTGTMTMYRLDSRLPQSLSRPWKYRHPQIGGSSSSYSPSKS